MNPRRILFLLTACAAVFLTSACVIISHAAAPANWSAKQIAVVENLNAPECMLPDPERGVVYISNIETSTEGYWEADGEGFISRLAPDGAMKELRWLDSSPAGRLNGPKGLCLLDGWLYINDLDQLKRARIETAGPVEVVPLAGAKRLNDAASDGRLVYVSDMEAGVVFAVDPKNPARETRTIPAPAAINGVTCHQGRLFAVSRDLHEVYELDPAGKQPPQPFGLAEQFQRLDGIEVLDDGTFVVSDFLGGRVVTIAPDRKTVRTLATMETPADVGIDRARLLMYVPQLKKNQGLVYKLSAE